MLAVGGDGVPEGGRLKIRDEGEGRAGIEGGQPAVETGGSGVVVLVAAAGEVEGAAQVVAGGDGLGVGEGLGRREQVALCVLGAGEGEDKGGSLGGGIGIVAEEGIGKAANEGIEVGIGMGELRGCTA